MPYCPECMAEYDAGIEICVDCGSDLVNRPPSFDPGEDPVVILHASTPAEARVAEATLEAEGIPAFVQYDDTVLPGIGNIESSPDLDVLVPADLADEAAAVLSQPSPTDDELAEAAGLDPEQTND